MELLEYSTLENNQVITPEIVDFNDEKYNQFSEDEKEFIYKLYFNKEIRDVVKQKLRKIIFQVTPPTPEEFLDPDNGFLPPSWINDIYPHVREDFIKGMDSKNPWAIISIYGSVRTGKSVLARLYTLYTIVYVSYLRDPHMYYHVSQMSRLCIYLVSFKDDKTRQVYLDPLLALLDSSPKFKREHYERYVYDKGVTADGVIHFSEASKFGDITFPKMHIVCGRDASSLVGADIIAGAISELSFFKEYVPGMTDDEVVQVFTKLSTRILNTVGYGSFPCWTYIDTSANDASSPLENMILKDLKNDPKVYFKHYILWELRPHLFPTYHKTGETFNVCVGDGNTPAKIVTNPEELKVIPKHLQIKVPIDLKQSFERKLLDQIKDVAGYPTSNDQKFISNINVIEAVFSNTLIKNVEGSIKIDSMEDPTNLIWNQLRDTFFTKYNDKEYRLMRAPNEPRWIQVDISHSVKGDMYGFGMLHLEYSRELKKNIYVGDLVFGFSSGTSGINLTAVEFFILDLIKLGHLSIHRVSSDTFQNKQMEQNLIRNGIEAFVLSVDRTLDPYLHLLNCLHNEVVKVGKNIFVKNNLNSLYRVKKKTGSGEKIDHSIGNTNNIYLGDWEHSDAGINAKDVSDVLAGACYSAFLSGYQPVICYEDENKKFSNTVEDNDFLLKQAYKVLHKYC